MTTETATTTNCSKNKKGIADWWKKNKAAILKEAKADTAHPGRFIKEVTINKIPFVFRHEKATGDNFIRFSTTDFIKLK